MYQLLKSQTAILTASMLLIAATALAFGPTTVSYQGRLTDSAGQPLNGTFQVNFAVYADSAGPSPAAWEETQTVMCVDGFFSVLLGETNPIGNAFLYYPQPYLGITVDTDPELLPRRKLAASMYSLRVNSVEGAMGGMINGSVVAGDLETGSTGMWASGGHCGGLFYGGDESSSTVGVEGMISPIVLDYDATGVKGGSITGDGYGIGGDFTGGWYGINAQAYIPDNSQAGHTGVHGGARGYSGDGGNIGVHGTAGGGYLNYGVLGYAYHNGTANARAYGVYGYAAFNDGYGAWAGYFDGWTTCKGTLEVQGTLTKTAGSFRIDHPLDPENKFLQHSFVESPDMKNIYDGNVVTDKNGDATVIMPEWFDALNRDFRYQLTVIGQFAQAIVSEKLRGNEFRIKTDKPNVEVSWQVTGIRQDAYANAHRIQVEVEKDPQQRGRYIDPLAFGKPEQLQLHYEIAKATEDQRKADEERMAKNRSERKSLPIGQ